MKQLNVVYLLADQLRARSLPAYGEGQIETPNIDRLAREGIRFTNATENQEPFCLFVAPHMPHHGGAIPGGRVTQDASPSGRLAPDDCTDHRPVAARMEATLERFMSEWHDAMQPATEYLNWFEGRRIVRNTFGPLGDPLADPDGSLL